MLQAVWVYITHWGSWGFPASRDERKASDVRLRARLIMRGRKSLSPVWCEHVKESWAICSTVAVVTWTRDEKRMGTGSPHPYLHAHSDWKSYGRLKGRLNPLSVDGFMLPVWPGDLPQSQTHSVQREDCNWWIPRFSLLWADVEPWDIYSHAGTGV